MKRSLLLFGLGLFALAACQENTLPKYEVLGGLRILALRADQGSQFSGQAEFLPGDSVVVTPYVSFYRVSAAVSYTATACPDPGVNVGASASCDGVAGAVALGSGTVTLTGGGSNTGQANSFTVSIPGNVLDNRRPIDQYNGVSYLVVYKLTSADGQSTSAVKRLLVSSASKTTKNQNPSVTALTAGGSPLTTLPGGEVELGISFPASARESYSSMLTSGGLETRTEDLLTTFFITDGTLKYGRVVDAQTSTYTPPSSAPTDHTAVLVAVVRDPRGGVAVSVVKLN